MRRVTIVASVGVLAFLTGGCSYFSFLPWVDDPEQLEGVVEEAPTPAPEASPNSEAEEFENPLEIGEQQTVAGLVQPTNPDERIRQVQKGRTDPFSGISVQPILIPQETPPVEPLPAPREQTPQRGDGRTPPAVATKPPQPRETEPSQATAKAPAASSSKPSPRAQERAIPSLEPGQSAPTEEGLQVPAPSQPAVASAIAVSGVVEVGTTPKAIIKAPNEDYSRYVQAGEYVSNGQVLVKRIEMRGGPYPTVIFEENGVEFARQVGSGGQTAEEGAETPTAFVSRSGGRV